MSKLSAIIRTFLGDAEAGAQYVADSLGDAVANVAQHGSRQPVEEAVTLINGLPGATKREKALRVALLTVSSIIAAVLKTPGKATAEEAKSIGARVAEEFAFSAMSVLTEKAEKPARTPADMIARACAALTKVDDKDLSRALSTPAVADLLTRLQGLKSAADATAAVRKARRAAGLPQQAQKAPAQAPEAPAQAVATVG